MLKVAKDNLNAYYEWLGHWWRSDLPSFDMCVECKTTFAVIIVFLIPTIILLHLFVLSGICVALFACAILSPIERLVRKCLSSIKAYIT